jgi:urease accessory protein
MWPSPELDELAAAAPEGPMFCVALGIIGRVVGIGAGEVALAAAQSSVTLPAFAAVRLLALDPYEVARALADLAPSIDATAGEALAAAEGCGSLRDLPAPGAPLQEIAAENRERWEVRLFVS